MTATAGGSQQIPREQWEEFLNQFTEFNQEMTCRLEVIGSAEAGTQVLAEDRPLLSVTLDDETGDTQIIIECGDTAGATPASFGHVVGNPKTLWAKKTDPVGWDALQIQTRDEGTVILTINPHPGRPTVDLDEAGRSETSVS
jgi:uncharacterized protein DUF5335